MSALAVHLMTGGSAIGSLDGIELLVAHGPLTGEVLLTWNGGVGPFQVSRSGEPGNLSDPGMAIWQTPNSNWVDTPPAAGIHYYHVMSSPGAVAKISEVKCYNSSAPEDFIEIYVLTGGSMGGWTIKEWAVGEQPTIEYMLDASFLVATGDYVVLHYDSANQGLFAQEDDVGSTKDESTATDQSVVAWDVYTSNTSCVSTDNFFLLSSAAGVEDSVAYSNRDGSMTTAMEAIFTWVYADPSLQWAGFTASADGSNDAEIQAQCAFGGRITGYSAQRDGDYIPGGGGFVDTDTNAEWCLAAHTMGIGIDCP